MPAAMTTMTGKTALVHMDHKQWRLGGGGRIRGNILANPPAATTATIFVSLLLSSLVEAGAGFEPQRTSLTLTQMTTTTMTKTTMTATATTMKFSMMSTLMTTTSTTMLSMLTTTKNTTTIGDVSILPRLLSWIKCRTNRLTTITRS